MSLNCLIIDDEPLARECIANYVRELPFLEAVGTGNNPLEIQSLMDQQRVDLIFLDIQMPKLNGIEYLKLGALKPMVIITTAFPSYALESFQLDVLDYLLKPITFQRFYQAASKAQDYHRLLNRSLGEAQHTTKPAEEDFFFVKCDHKYEKIFFANILYIQAMQNYVVIYTTEGKYITLLSLKSVEQKLDPAAFIRVHKSYIAAIAQVSSIESHEMIIGPHRIPVSRHYREDVLSRVVKDRLWRK
ncbi:MAG: LytTR family DNA-binding domain-containing protein [Bacteroidota bacterium]